MESSGGTGEAIESGAIQAEEALEGISACGGGEIRPGFLKGHGVKLRGATSGEAACGTAAIGGLGGVGRTIGTCEKFGLSRAGDGTAKRLTVGVKFDDREAVEVVFESLDEVAEGVKKVLWRDRSANVCGGGGDKFCGGLGRDVLAHEAEAWVLLNQFRHLLSVKAALGAVT